jgi:hypothetical protein
MRAAQGTDGDKPISRAEAEAQLDTIFGQLRAWMIRMARAIDG